MRSVSDSKILLFVRMFYALTANYFIRIPLYLNRILMLEPRMQNALFDSVVELSDRLLDRVDHDLDRQEALQMAAEQQRVAQLAPSTQAGNGSALVSSARRAMPSTGSASASTMVANKPQLRWRDEVDNSSRPFVPKLRSKPNAILPLELRLEQPDDAGRDVSPLSALGTAASSARPQPAAWYANPYTPEINAFVP